MSSAPSAASAIRPPPDLLDAQAANATAALRKEQGARTLQQQLAVAVRQLEQEVRDLQGKIADESARQKHLTLARDVAWDTSSSLVKKAEEARVATVVGAGNEVSVASQAVVAQPKPRRLGMILPLAAILGAMAAATWLVLADALGGLYQRAQAQANGRAGPAPGPLVPVPEEVGAG